MTDEFTPNAGPSAPPEYDPKIDGPTLVWHPTNTNHPVAWSPLGLRLVRNPYYQPPPSPAEVAAQRAADEAQRVASEDTARRHRELFGGNAFIPTIAQPTDPRKAPAEPAERDIDADLAKAFGRYGL